MKVSRPKIQSIEDKYNEMAKNSKKERVFDTKKNVKVSEMYFVPKGEFAVKSSNNKIESFAKGNFHPMSTKNFGSSISKDKINPNYESRIERFNSKREIMKNKLLSNPASKEIITDPTNDPNNKTLEPNSNIEIINPTKIEVIASARPGKPKCESIPMPISDRHFTDRLKVPDCNKSNTIKNNKHKEENKVIDTANDYPQYRRKMKSEFKNNEKIQKKQNESPKISKDDKSDLDRKSVV